MHLVCVHSMFGVGRFLWEAAGFVLWQIDVKKENFFFPTRE